jgi:hypothetical protein
VLAEPLRATDAEKLIKTIARTGDVAFHSHAARAMADDHLTAVDVVNVLRGGYVEGEAEFVSPSWRYKMRTQRIVVPVRFVNETTVEVVTTWRVR